MAKAVTLKNGNNEEVYPVTDMSLVNGTVGTSKLADNSITAVKLFNNSVSTDKVRDGAITGAKIDWSTVVPEAITVSDYINFTVGSSSSTASGYKIGPLVVICFERLSANVVSGEKQLGTCTNRIKTTIYGAGRASSSGDAIPATFIAIPGGALRCHTTASRTNCAGTIWLLEA